MRLRKFSIKIYICINLKIFHIQKSQNCFAYEFYFLYTMHTAVGYVIRDMIVLKSQFDVKSLHRNPCFEFFDSG